MSQNTTRSRAGAGIERTATQRVPFRTVAGSYEAPVEGIVDYGAFQRGFESTFEMPEEEEGIKLPEAFTDIDFLGGRSKTGNLGFNEIAINQYKGSISKELSKLQDEYDLAYIRHGEGSREVGKVNEKVEKLKKIVLATDLGIKTMVDAEGAFDMQQAKLNPSLQGYSYDAGSGERVNSPFVDLVNTKNQNDGSNFSLFIDYESGAGGISANGFLYDVSTLNDTNKNSLIPSVSGIDEKATDFAKKNKIVLQTNQDTTGNVGASTKQTTTTYYTPESVNALNKGAKVFADTEYDPNKASDDYGATFLDAVFGVHRRRGQATQEQLNAEENVAFIDSFGPEGFEGSNGKFYTFEDFKEHISNKAQGQDGSIPTKIEGEFVKLFAENDFKINVGSELYTSNSYGVAVRREDLESTSRRKADEVEEEETVSGFGFGSTPGLSDASRILAQINFNQSGAKGASLNYFKGIEVKGGTIINPRIVREGKNKFLVYDTRSSSGSVAKYGKEEDNRFPEQRFNLSDTEDRTRLARLKALTLTGADEGTDDTIESLPQAIKLRTDTQDVFGFYSLQNREKLITGKSKYANAILTPGWESWWNTNKGNYNQVPDNKTEQIKRSENILKDFNLSIN